MINKKFDRLTVKEQAVSQNKRKRWLCVCRCGNTKIVTTHGLNSKAVRSCGCLAKEVQSRTGKGVGTRNILAANRARWTGCGEISGFYWTHLQQGARERSIPFEITIKYAWRLFLRQRRKRALSGREIAFKRFGASRAVFKDTASLDRINSDKGYVKRNVQWLHKDINRLKNNYRQQEFIVMCKEVAKNNP